MLAAYIHESEDEFGCAVGGLAGTMDSFVEMGREWDRMLFDFGIRSLQMDPLLRRTEEFAGWDVKRVNSLLEVAAGIIVRRASSVHGYFVDKRDCAAAAESSIAYRNCRFAAALRTVEACGVWGRQSSSSVRLPIVFDEDGSSPPDIDGLTEAARANGTIERLLIGEISCAGSVGYGTLQAAALVAEECRQEFRNDAGSGSRFRPFRARTGRGKPSFKRVFVEELMRR